VTRKCIIRPAAQAEIDQQADYLAQNASEETALRFLAAVEKTIALLVRTPGIGSPWISSNPRLEGIRRQQVAGLPSYLVFYRHDDQSIEVLHLYHARQEIEGRLTEDADSSCEEPGGP
jgi:toxin ParE1/3/4